MRLAIAIVVVASCVVAVAQTQAPTLTDKVPGAKPFLLRYENQKAAASKKYEDSVAAARTEMFNAFGQYRQDLIKSLTELKDSHTKAGKLDEAVLLRDEAAKLKAETDQAKPETTRPMTRTAEQLNKLLSGTKWASDHSQGAGDKGWVKLNADHSVTAGWHQQGGVWAAIAGDTILLQAFPTTGPKSSSSQWRLMGRAANTATSG